MIPPRLPVNEPGDDIIALLLTFIVCLIRTQVIVEPRRAVVLPNSAGDWWVTLLNSNSIDLLLLLGTNVVMVPAEPCCFNSGDI